MQRYVLGLSLAFGLVGCAAPTGTSSPPAADRDPLRTEVAQLKESVSRLENRLGHLETEISASSAEGELTAMTIDSVQWSKDPSVSRVFGHGPILLCHVVEWRGYGKMLR